jgi:hypothetical protein
MPADKMDAAHMGEIWPAASMTAIRSTSTRYPKKQLKP